MRNGKTVAAFIAVLLASFTVMSVMSPGDLPQAFMQETVLALVALAGVGFAAPNALKRCTDSVQHRNRMQFVSVALLAVGFVGGAITLATWDFSGASAVGCPAFALTLSNGDVVRNLVLLLGICALTGIYEEAFMRVLGIEAIEQALGQDGQGGRARSWFAADSSPVKERAMFGGAARRAVLVSALLFALLHVGVPDPGAEPAVLLQTALKFAQSLLFGVILGVLYAQTRRLWPCALLHAGFDVLYLAPQVFLTGALPAAYASGAASDTVLLAVTVALLAVVAVAQAVAVSRRGGAVSGSDGSGDGND